MSTAEVRMVAGSLVCAFLSANVGAQTARIVEFPDPVHLYQNSTFAVDGAVGYVPTFDRDTLWSFSLITGDLLDEDGLALPEPATASDPFLFPGKRLAIPGWFPSQGVFVADVSDPSSLAQVGIITFPQTTNIQGQNVEIDANGQVGYVAGFPDDTLYSFNVSTLQLEDPDGLALPGNPDRIALAGDRLALVDTTNGRIMVADVSNPANLTLAGTIALPPGSTFNSNDNIVFAADGRTGFVTSNQRMLYSFDVQTLTRLDADGLLFGSQGGAGHLAIGADAVACIWDRGLSFIDVSNPTALALIAEADFGGVVAPQGSATTAFSGDGTKAAVPMIFPGNRVYTFEVASGVQASPPFSVSAQPNFLTIFGATDQVGTLCASGNDNRIWLIDGLLGKLVGDLNCDGAFDGADIDPFFLALGDPADYAAQYPGCEPLQGDANQDGALDGADIDAFFARLGG